MGDESGVELIDASPFPEFNLKNDLYTIPCTRWKSMQSLHLKASDQSDCLNCKAGRVVN